METQLKQKEEEEEEKYGSNQEEGFNPKLLRLGSPIPTPTPTDQESPIMFSDSVQQQRKEEKYSSNQEESLCEKSKKTILIDDPSSMKEASASSIDYESSNSTLLDNENLNSQKAMCASKKRKQLLISSFVQRKKTILIDDPSSMKEAAAAYSSIEDLDRSPPIRHSSSFLHQITPNSSPPPQTCPPFLSKSVSSTPTPTNSVQKSDDQKPNVDGNCEQMQIVPWFITVDVIDGAGIQDLCFDLLSYLVAHFSPPDAAKVPCLSKRMLENFQQQNLIRIDDSRYAAIPTLNKVILEMFAKNPKSIDSKIISSLDPVSLHIDFDRLGKSLIFCLVSYKVRDLRIEYFIESLLKAYKDMSRLRLSGQGNVSRYLLSRKFNFLKYVSMFDVTISSAKDLMFSTSLEELQLKNCRVPSRFKLKLQNGANLQSFVMDSCVGLRNEGISDIVLKVPSLLKFRFHGWVSVLNTSEAKNLLEADIQFKGITRARNMLGSNFIYRFLNCLKYVKKLNICNMCIKNIRGTGLANKLLFPNLKELNLSISLEDEEKVKDLVSILTSVPILAQLSIKVQHSWFISPGFWRSNTIRFDHLNFFWMKPFNGEKSGMEFLGHLLMNAGVLKKAEVVLVYGLQCNSLSQCEQQKLMEAYAKATSVRKEILALPRASAEAEVIVILDEGFLVTV